MMKKLLNIVIVFFAFTAFAKQSDIAALVNDKPITMYELQARKKMLLVVNNIHNPSVTIMNQISKVAINSLIDEQLLFEHAEKVGAKIGEEEIDEAIKTVEEKNSMASGHLTNYLKTHGVDISSYRSQIKSELIKMQIFSHLSKSITVSPKEIDSVILSTNSKDAKVHLQIFTANNNTGATYNKMISLQKRLKTCEQVKDSLYKGFADLTVIKDKLSDLDPQLQTIVKDLNDGQASKVIEGQNNLKIVQVCKKSIENISNEENAYVLNFLTNKKMQQKAKKFLENLRKKAFIKIMIQSAQ